MTPLRTRRLTAGLALGLIFGMVALDLAASPPDPYAAPLAISLGSGVVATGGFCGALPE